MLFMAEWKSSCWKLSQTFFLSDIHNPCLHNGNFLLLSSVIWTNPVLFTSELLSFKGSQGFDMSPAEVLTDSDLAAIQATEVAFLTSKVKGCFFCVTSLADPP